MSDHSEFHNIYSGSEVRVILLKGLLEQAGIDTVVQNEFQSGITAGFAGGNGPTVSGRPRGSGSVWRRARMALVPARANP